MTTPSDSTNASTCEITVKGKGNYTGEVTKTYTISPATIGNGDVRLSRTDFTYTGDERKPSVTVTVNGRLLISNTDYTLDTPTDSTNVSTYETAVTGTGNYTGTVTKSYTISVATGGTVAVTLDKTDFTYNGTVQKPSVISVKYNGNILTSNDYDLEIPSDSKNAGTYTVTATLKGNYSSALKGTQTYKIARSTIDDGDVRLSGTNFTYNGNAQRPSVSVTVNGRALTANTDYTLNIFANSINASTYEIAVTGNGNYNGRVTKTYTISPAIIGNGDVRLSGTSFTYNGDEQRPSVMVSVDGTSLIANTNYALDTPSGSTNVATYETTVTGKGNYAGTVTKTYTISPATIGNNDVRLSRTDFTYTGDERKPSVTVVVNGKTLTANTDYTLNTPTNSINVSSNPYEITVTGNGNYNGTVTKAYTISPATSGTVVVTFDRTNFTYNGTVQKPSVITVKYNDKILTSNDYDLNIPYDSKNVGTYTVTATLKGNYSSTLKGTQTYAISPAIN